MPESIELHRWRVRDGLTGKVRVTRHLATEAEARAQYGERLIEAVPGTREVREVGDPDRNRTSAWRK